MRYFLTLSYRGTHYCGWQIQPNGTSVQAVLEEAGYTILRERIAITGCGRTDAGVHARYYVAHFDAKAAIPDSFLYRINGILPEDIAVHSIQPVQAQAHARFDAVERSYQYHLDLGKNPFHLDTAWYFSRHERLDLEKMQGVANLLPRYPAFSPFCKSHSGVDTYECDLRSAYWQYSADRQQLVFFISANRFLRGMVRLIVGACLQVGLGKMAVEEVKIALEKQQALKKNLSVPPIGLFLTNVQYPYPVAGPAIPALIL